MGDVKYKGSSIFNMVQVDMRIAWHSLFTLVLLVNLPCDTCQASTATGSSRKRPSNRFCLLLPFGVLSVFVAKPFEIVLFESDEAQGASMVT